MPQLSTLRDGHVSCLSFETVECRRLRQQVHKPEMSSSLLKVAEGLQSAATVDFARRACTKTYITERKEERSGNMRRYAASREQALRYTLQISLTHFKSFGIFRAALIAAVTRTSFNHIGEIDAVVFTHPDNLAFVTVKHFKF